MTTCAFRPAGGAGGGLLGPGRAGDDVALQELHPADDRAERVRALPGGAAVRSHHQASDERTEGPVEDERRDSSHLALTPPPSFSANRLSCTAPTPATTSGTPQFILPQLKICIKCKTEKIKQKSSLGRKLIFLFEMSVFSFRRMF